MRTENQINIFILGLQQAGASEAGVLHAFQDDSSLLEKKKKMRQLKQSRQKDCAPDTLLSGSIS